MRALCVRDSPLFPKTPFFTPTSLGLLPIKPTCRYRIEADMGARPAFQEQATLLRLAADDSVRHLTSAWS